MKIPIGSVIDVKQSKIEQRGVKESCRSKPLFLKIITCILSAISAVTLNASGRTSATTIQIIHPAAKPVQNGRNLLNASAHIKEGTATMGCQKFFENKDKGINKHQGN